VPRVFISSNQFIVPDCVYHKCIWV
jgi:hypothetical protein